MNQLSGPSLKTRLELLRELLSSGASRTQEEIRSQMEERGISITQSTVSRDLRRVGAIKAIDEAGRTIYRFGIVPTPSLNRATLSELVLSIVSNGMQIVIRTTSGSAPLVAARIDQVKPGGILGTLAGDDTIFVAPASASSIPRAIEEIKQTLLS